MVGSDVFVAKFVASHAFYGKFEFDVSRVFT